MSLIRLILLSPFVFLLLIVSTVRLSCAASDVLIRRLTFALLIFTLLLNVKILIDWIFCFASSPQAWSIAGFVHRDVLSGVSKKIFDQKKDTSRGVGLQLLAENAGALTEEILCRVSGGYEDARGGLGSFIEIIFLWIPVMVNLFRLPVPVKSVFYKSKRSWYIMATVVCLSLLVVNVVILFNPHIRLLRWHGVYKAQVHSPKREGPSASTKANLFQENSYLYAYPEPVRFKEIIYGLSMKEKKIHPSHKQFCKAKGMGTRHKYLRGSVEVKTIALHAAHFDRLDVEEGLCYDVEGSSGLEFLTVNINGGKKPFSLNYTIMAFDGSTQNAYFIKDIIEDTVRLPIDSSGVYSLTAIADCLCKEGRIEGGPVQIYKCPRLEFIDTSEKDICVGDEIEGTTALVFARSQATLQYSVISEDVGALKYQDSITETSSKLDESYSSLRFRIPWPSLNFTGLFLLKVTSIQDGVGNEAKLFSLKERGPKVKVHSKPELLEMICSSADIVDSDDKGEKFGVSLSVLLSGRPPFSLTINFYSEDEDNKEPEIFEVSDINSFEYEFDSSRLGAGLYVVSSVQDAFCKTSYLSNKHECMIKRPYIPPKPRVALAKSARQTCVGKRSSVAEVWFSGNGPWTLKFSIRKILSETEQENDSVVEDVLVSASPTAELFGYFDEPGVYEYGFISISNSDYMSQPVSSSSNGTGMTFTVIVDPEPSVSYGEEISSPIFRCKSAGFQLPLNFEGTPPFTLKVDEKSGSRGRLVTMKNIEKYNVDLWDLHSWREGERVEYTLIHVSDATSCQKELHLPPVIITSQAESATAVWGECGENNVFAIKEGTKNTVSIYLKGQTPFRVVYGITKPLEKDYERIVVQNINEYELVIEVGENNEMIEILEVSDTSNQCAGVVSEQNRCHVRWIEKPAAEVMGLSSAFCATSATNILDIAHLQIFGTPPFQVVYQRIRIPFKKDIWNAGELGNITESGVDNSSLMSEIYEGTITTWNHEYAFSDMVDQKMVGIYRYEFLEVYDAKYTRESKTPGKDISGDRRIDIMLHGLPMATLDYGVSLYCDSIYPKDVSFPIFLEGKPPFKVSIEVSETILHAPKQAIHSGEDILKDTGEELQEGEKRIFQFEVKGDGFIQQVKLFASLSSSMEKGKDSHFDLKQRKGKERQYVIRIVKITDGNNCTHSPTSSAGNMKTIKVGPEPIVSLSDSKSQGHSCVSDDIRLDFWGGHPPFEVTYQLDGEIDTIVVDEEMHVYVPLVFPGLFQVLSVKNSYCESNNLSIQRNVYDIPTASLEKGKEGIQKKRCENESVKIPVKLTGTPPCKYAVFF